MSHYYYTTFPSQETLRLPLAMVHSSEHSPSGAFEPTLQLNLSASLIPRQGGVLAALSPRKPLAAALMLPRGAMQLVRQSTYREGG